MYDAQQKFDVILLDDDPDFRDLFVTYARRADLSADAVSDPRALIENFNERSAPLCIVDLNMEDPYGVNWRFAGVSTLIEFRRRYGQDVDLWVISGIRNPSLISTCFKAGATEFLSKNLGFDDIVQRVRSRVQELRGRELAQEPEANGAARPKSLPH